VNDKNDKLGQLAERIEAELSELEKVTGRIREGWERFRRTGDDFYTDSTALNMHGFYSGTERVFQLIARTVDGSVPQGANWHRMLLEARISTGRMLSMSLIPVHTPNWMPAETTSPIPQARGQ